MRAIILAAGLGSRLKPFTDTVPKCLTEVNGKQILVNALENLEGCGIQEVTIVVGYLKDKIKAAIGDTFGGMAVAYAENDNYATTNTSASLELGLAAINGEDILILEGDVFFSQRLLEEFLASKASNSTVVQKYNSTLDGSFVALESGHVVDWIHKSRRASDFIIEDKFKTVNIHKFDALFVGTTLKPILSQHVDAAEGKEPIEHVMEDIVKRGSLAISVFEVGDLKWFEIDDVNDLKVAEDIFSRPSLDAIRSLHGGYWRYDHLDFHYLCNQYFPPAELYAELARKLPLIGNYYPSSQRIVAQSLAKWKSEEYFIADNLIVGNGSSELIKILNDHVITKATVPLPTFNEFTKLPSDQIHKYVLDEEDKFSLDSDRLIAEIAQSHSEFAVIVNPNNPVGNLTPLSEIEKILNTGVTLIVDEAFMAFAGDSYSAEQLVSQYANLVVVVSCTKSLGVGGLRLAYMLTTNAKIKETVRRHLPIWNVNSITECLIEIFPRYRQEYVESIAKSVADTSWFFESLKEISYLTPYQTYSNAVFCKVQGSARKLVEILYDDYNMMVKEGLNQKEIVTDSYIRLGVRNRQDNRLLLLALQKIDRYNIMAEAEQISRERVLI